MNRPDISGARPVYIFRIISPHFSQVETFADKHPIRHQLRIRIHTALNWAIYAIRANRCSRSFPFPPCIPGSIFEHHHLPASYILPVPLFCHIHGMKDGVVPYPVHPVLCLPVFCSSSFFLRSQPSSFSAILSLWPLIFGP